MNLNLYRLDPPFRSLSCEQNQAPKASVLCAFYQNLPSKFFKSIFTAEFKLLQLQLNLNCTYCGIFGTKIVIINLSYGCQYHTTLFCCCCCCCAAAAVFYRDIKSPAKILLCKADKLLYRMLKLVNIIWQNVHSACLELRVAPGTSEALDDGRRTGVRYSLSGINHLYWC